MASAFANSRSQTIPYGVDIDLTHGAFRLPAVFEKSDTKWHGYKSARVFKHPQLKKMKDQKNSAGGDGEEKPTDDNKSAHSGADQNGDQESVAEFGYDVVRKAIIGFAMEKYLAGIKSKLVNFSDIVDLDDEAFEDRVSSDYVGRFNNSDGFKVFMTSVIVVNAILIAVETNEAAVGSAFKLVDTIFLALFMIEIALKWYVSFFSFWKSGWNVFDFVIVASAVLAPAITFISSGRVLRILRILRAFRALRGATALEGLRSVAKTILESIPDMLNIMVLLLLLMFIFSVLGVTLFKLDQPDDFGDLSAAMFTLFVLITQDGWYDKFVKLEAKGHFTVAALFFVVFITIGAFIFANLIIAVVVTNLERAYDQLKKSHQARYRLLKGQADQSAPVNRNVALLGEIKDETWSNQIPYEVPDLTKVSKEKLEQYYLILTLLEENMHEYKVLKNQLKPIVAEVKDLNAENKDDVSSEEYPEGFDDDADLDAPMDLGPGDPLSRMLRG